MSQTAAGVLLAFAGAAIPAVAPDAATTPARRDTHENLHAVLWMQTAAEYQALTRGLYRAAAVQLDRALDDHRWTAIPEQAGRPDLPMLPPAVILDVDETVVDNSPEEGQRVLDRAGYEKDIFGAWVNRQEAGTVPGAAEFIRYAVSRQVDVYLVSNRDPEQRDATVATLHKRGVEVPPDHVLCYGDHAAADNKGDKTGRRQFVAANHRVLLLAGDDLGDFVSLTGAGGQRLDRAARTAVMDRFSGYWEERWILLPNPAYGSWEHTFYPDGASDADTLAALFAGVRGFQKP